MTICEFAEKIGFIMKTYRIPLLHIQGYLMELDNNPKILKLNRRLDNIIEKERDNWGIKGMGYKVDCELEAQWYPVYEFKNRWLANWFLINMYK